MKRLPKKITNEIRFILEGCRDGKLKHVQHEVHCGSAHCICGWKAVMDYKQVMSDTNEPTVRDLERFCVNKAKLNPKAGIRQEWAYAQQKWQLTAKEADALFDGGISFSEQFALLEKLEAGERII